MITTSSLVLQRASLPAAAANNPLQAITNIPNTALPPTLNQGSPAQTLTASMPAAAAAASANTSVNAGATGAVPAPSIKYQLPPPPAADEGSNGAASDASTNNSQNPSAGTNDMVSFTATLEQRWNVADRASWLAGWPHDAASPGLLLRCASWCACMFVAPICDGHICLCCCK